MTLIKRIEDLINPKIYVSWLNFHYQIIKLEHCHSHPFSESLNNCVKVTKKGSSSITLRCLIIFKEC